MLEMRTDIPVPRPSPRDVLIRVAAAGVNNTDINTRTAWYSKQDGASDDASWSGAPLHFPRIQGIDVCGRIVAVGTEVGADRIGARVLVEPCLREANGRALDRAWFFGSECDGGFAEFTVVASRHAHDIESPLSDAELASFPCSYSTAENLLTRSKTGAGDRLLVTGASGGVGSAVIQLARVRGARVIAVTSPAKSDDIRRLGAERIFTRDDSVVEELGRDSIDVVIDLVGGARWPELLDVLRPGGRYAVAGAVGGAIVELDIRTLYLKDLSLLGCTVLEPAVFANLIQHIESGRIAPLVAKTFPLARIGDAQSAFMAKNYTGKIVLTVDAENALDECRA
jgi:NADPH:quinone reductase-like Zn-dependent oxidoreductase